MPFQFKQFTIEQDQCTMKVGTDGVLLGAWANVQHTHHILDIGTGTGVIAIMLAQRAPTAKVIGVEIEEKSCLQATQNMQNSPFANRLSAAQQSIQDFAKEYDGGFDLIVSNPPFFSGGTFSDKEDRNNVRHTIKLSHGDLFRSVQKLLKKDGRFCVILPLIEGLRFEEMAATYQFFCHKKTEVKPKAEKPVERLLLEFRRQKAETKTNQIVIQKEVRNDWTDDYIALTKDFYLNI